MRMKKKKNNLHNKPTQAEQKLPEKRNSKQKHRSNKPLNSDGMRKAKSKI